MAQPLTTVRFRAWVRKARKLFPLDKPVEVRRVAPSRMGGAIGLSWDLPNRYVIWIDRTVCKAATWDTLVHEWCHLMRHEFERDEEGLHDDTFWILYGSMYRAWDGEP